MSRKLIALEQLATFKQELYNDAPWSEGGSSYIEVIPTDIDIDFEDETASISISSADYAQILSEQPDFIILDYSVAGVKLIFDKQQLLQVGGYNIINYYCIVDNVSGASGSVYYLQLGFTGNNNIICLLKDLCKQSGGACEYTILDFYENDQTDQSKLAEVYSVCPQVLRVHSNNDGLQMYRLDIDYRIGANQVFYSCLIGGGIVELSLTESGGTYTLGVVRYNLTPVQ